MSWSSQQLEAISDSNDFHVAPFRDDGETYGTLTYIWSVVVGEAVYIRAYGGTSSSWYQAAISQKAGKIKAAGEEIEVSFEPVNDSALNDQIDDAYRGKYSDSSYLDPMISDRARNATVRVMPRD